MDFGGIPRVSCSFFTMPFKYLQILWNWLSLGPQSLSLSQQLASGPSESWSVMLWTQPLSGPSVFSFDARGKGNKTPTRIKLWSSTEFAKAVLPLADSLFNPEILAHSPIIESYWLSITSWQYVQILYTFLPWGKKSIMQKVLTLNFHPKIWVMILRLF